MSTLRTGIHVGNWRGIDQCEKDIVVASSTDNFEYRVLVPRITDTLHLRHGDALSCPHWLLSNVTL